MQGNKKHLSWKPVYCPEASETSTIHRWWIDSHGVLTPFLNAENVHYPWEPTVADVWTANPTSYSIIAGEIILNLPVSQRGEQYSLMSGNFVIENWVTLMYINYSYTAQSGSLCFTGPAQQGKEEVWVLV